MTIGFRVQRLTTTLYITLKPYFRFFSVSQLWYSAASYAVLCSYDIGQRNTATGDLDPKPESAHGTCLGIQILL